MNQGESKPVFKWDFGRTDFAWAVVVMWELLVVIGGGGRWFWNSRREFGEEATQHARHKARQWRQEGGKTILFSVAVWGGAWRGVGKENARQGKETRQIYVFKQKKWVEKRTDFGMHFGEEWMCVPEGSSKKSVRKIGIVKKVQPFQAICSYFSQ